MIKSLKIISVLAIIVLLAGCATRRPGSSEIQLLYSKKGLEKCMLLGNVRGAEHLIGGAFAGVAHRNARVRMINKAVLMGADTLYMQGRHFWWFGASAYGEAYKCDDVNLSQ